MRVSHVRHETVFKSRHFHCKLYNETAKWIGLIIKKGPGNGGPWIEILELFGKYRFGLYSMLLDGLSAYVIVMHEGGNVPEILFLVFFIAILGWVIFVFFSKRGKGIMFGGRIIKTYEGVSAKRKIFSNKIKVHAVDGGPVRFVGLEMSASSFGSYQMIPVTFPASEARELAALLIEAAEYQENA